VVEICRAVNHFTNLQTVRDFKFSQK
jgi:hypothetical protein